MTRVWLVGVALLASACTLNSDQRRFDAGSIEAGTPDSSLPDAQADSSRLCSDVDGAAGDAGADAGGDDATAGERAVRVVASGQDGPEAVVSDGVHVFWITLGIRGPLGSVMRADPDGANLFGLIPTATPCDLALDATSAWVSMCNSNTLVRVNKEANQLDTPAQATAAGAVATSTSGVFWIDRGTHLNTGAAIDDGAIIELRTAGGVVGPADRLTTHERAPLELVADGDTAYWTTEAGGAISSIGPSRVVLPVATGLDRPRSLQLDEGALYWLEPAAGVVRTIGKQACTPRTLASGLIMPTAIAVDASSLYIGNGDGRLLRMPKRGGATAVLADGQLDFESIAVDDRFVYWTDVRAGTVMRAGK